jgi:superfamily II DNA or RNA helicase
MTIVVRDFQERVKEDARNSIRRGKKKIIIQAPTGAGKTVIAAGMIRNAQDKGNPVLFFAHRRELIYQCGEKLERFGVRHGILMAGEYPDHYAGVQVASIDTFRARVIQRQRLEWPKASLVFIDEAHRSLSPTYLEVIQHYSEAGAIVVGLTATPIRGDGRGLGHVYEDMVRAPSVPELINMGYLVPPRHFAPSIPDLTGVKTKAGDYDAQDLERALNRKELIGDIVSTWSRLGQNRPTIVFASGVDHSIAIREAFRAVGVNAEHIDANTPDHDRAKIYDRLRKGFVKVITNCMVLTEGFDEPTLSCCVLARPTKNKGLYIQMGGRVLRPSEGKTDALILDHSGSVYRHGKLDDHVHWTLDTRRKSEAEAKREERKREATQITCRVCQHVYSGQLVCPMCGNVPQRLGNMIVARDGTLVELGSSNDGTKSHRHTPEEIVHWIGMFKQHVESSEGKKTHVWARYRLNEKFGMRISNEVYERAPLRQANREFLGYVHHLRIKYAKRKKLEGVVS